MTRNGALGADDAELGDTVAVVDTSRTPERRLTERVVKRVRTFGDKIVCRVTIGVLEQADYSFWSVVAADVETLKDDIVGIDGDLPRYKIPIVYVVVGVIVVYHRCTSCPARIDFCLRHKINWLIIVAIVVLEASVRLRFGIRNSLRQNL